MRRATLLLTGLLALAGCGGDALPDTSDLPTESTATSAEAETTTAEATTPSPPGPEVLALGQTFTAPSGTRATAYRVVRPAAPDAPRPEVANSEWAALEVEVCVAAPVPPDAFVTGESWKLQDSNNGQYGRASVGYLQFPIPEFPRQQPVAGGEASGDGSFSPC